MKSYPLLDVAVSTPKLELRGATDDLLDRLAEVVWAGKTHADPAPYDDPMSFYELIRTCGWPGGFAGSGGGEAGSRPTVGGCISLWSWMVSRSVSRR